MVYDHRAKRRRRGHTDQLLPTLRRKSEDLGQIGSLMPAASMSSELLPVYLRVLSYLIGSVGFVVLWSAPSWPILTLGFVLVCSVEILLRLAKMAANPSFKRTRLRRSA